MQVLWNLEKGFVKDIMNAMPESESAYNTVSTIVRILEKKGFVSHIAYGKTHEYFPLITKAQYRKKTFSSLVSNYFEDSYSNLVSFLVKEKKLNQADIDELKRIIEKGK